MRPGRCAQKAPRFEEPERIDATFRGGSITAVSVIVGFSLGFLSRWAGQPGGWSVLDLCAVSAISVGIACQIVAFNMMLGYRSLLMRVYKRSIAIFLVGLAFVAAGVAAAILGAIAGIGQNVLGG